ncbi:MAG: protease inhibitor I42 family protein, partial [Bacteroidota bacterium]
MDTVNLKKGKTFVLELKGLASAGFMWQYTVDNKDLVSIKVDYKLPEPLSPKNMGASANEIFTITALQKGEA